MVAGKRKACKVKRLMRPWGERKVGRAEQGEVGRRRWHEAEGKGGSPPFPEGSYGDASIVEPAVRAGRGVWVTGRQTQTGGTCSVLLYL